MAVVSLAVFLLLITLILVAVAAHAQQQSRPLTSSDVTRALGYTPMNQSTANQPGGAVLLDGNGALLNPRLDGNPVAPGMTTLPIAGCGTGATATGSALDGQIVTGSTAGATCGPITLPGSWNRAPACVATPIGIPVPISIINTAPNSGSITLQFPDAEPSLTVTYHCWG